MEAAQRVHHRRSRAHGTRGTIDRHRLRCVAASIVSSTGASASTATTDPTGSTAAHTDAEHATDTTEVTLAVDGSAEPTSPEAEAFCAAELTAEAAVTVEDEAAIGAAAEVIMPPPSQSASPTQSACCWPPSRRVDQSSTRPRRGHRLHEGQLWIRRARRRRLGVSLRRAAIGATGRTDDHHPRQRRRSSPRALHRTASPTTSPSPSRNSPSFPRPTPRADGHPDRLRLHLPRSVPATAPPTSHRPRHRLCFLPEGATPEVRSNSTEAGVDGLEDSLPAGSRSDHALHDRNDRRVQRRLTPCAMHQDSNGRIDRRPHRPIPRY